MFKDGKTTVGGYHVNKEVYVRGARTDLVGEEVSCTCTRGPEKMQQTEMS